MGSLCAAGVWPLSVGSLRSSGQVRCRCLVFRRLGCARKAAFRMRPLDDGFDIVTVRIKYEGRVIAGVILARAGCSVVASSCGESGCMEGAYLRLGFGTEGDMSEWGGGQSGGLRRRAGGK